MPIKKTATQHPRNSQRRFTKDEPARTKQHLLCKTKPISEALLMPVTSAITSAYDNKPPLEAPKNKANSKPIGKKAATLAKLHQIRATSSELRSSVPIRHLWPGFLRYRQPARTKQHLLCKTKPISQPLLTTVTSALTSTYEEKPPLEAPKNKANSKPIGKKAATLAKLHQIRATTYEKESNSARAAGLRIFAFCILLFDFFPPLQPPARTKQHLLCKTKPISEGIIMTVTSALTSTYEEKPPPEAPKNKANSKPIRKKPATAKPKRRNRIQP